MVVESNELKKVDVREAESVKAARTIVAEKQSQQYQTFQYMPN